MKFPGVDKKPFQDPSRPIPAGKHKAQGVKQKTIGPKGGIYFFVGVGWWPIQKPPRPISAGKHKPKGGEKIITGPESRKLKF